MYSYNFFHKRHKFISIFFYLFLQKGITFMTPADLCLKLFQGVESGWQRSGVVGTLKKA